MWDKYIFQLERNTFCNLRQIHFAIWDKYILQFMTNTFCCLKCSMEQCQSVSGSLWQSVAVCKIRIRIPKYICLKLQNVFVSNCKMYLSQIAKCHIWASIEIHFSFISVSSKLYSSCTPAIFQLLNSFYLALPFPKIV